MKAAVRAELPAGKPLAAPRGPELPAPELALGESAAPAASQTCEAPGALLSRLQEAAAAARGLAAPQARKAPGALPGSLQRAAAAGRSSRAAAPATSLARRAGASWAQEASPGPPQGTAATRKGSREGAKYRAHTQPSQTPLSTPKH